MGKTQDVVMVMGRPAFSAATLKVWRARMGYSERDAAQALGCSREALRGWESGKHPVPRYIGLACAALALGVDKNGEAA